MQVATTDPLPRVSPVATFQPQLLVRVVTLRLQAGMVPKSITPLLRRPPIAPVATMEYRLPASRPNTSRHLTIARHATKQVIPIGCRPSFTPISR